MLAGLHASLAVTYSPAEEPLDGTGMALKHQAMFIYAATNHKCSFGEKGCRLFRLEDRYDVPMCTLAGACTA